MPPNKIDRRDFVTGSITAVGASAIVAGEAGAATPQEDTKTRASELGTVYTSEVVQGKKVVSRLNVADLESGKKHFLYFQGETARCPPIAPTPRRSPETCWRSSCSGDQNRPLDMARIPTAKALTPSNGLASPDAGVPPARRSDAATVQQCRAAARARAQLIRNRLN